MILFCNAFMLYVYFLFSAFSNCTKNKFNGYLAVLCCAFIMFRSFCPS